MEKPIELVNLKSIEKALNGLEKSLKEKRSALLHRIGNHLQNRISESFEEERSPLGGKWKPLALSTLERYYKRRYKQKHKKRFGGWGSKQEKKQALESFRGEKRILQDEGHLLGSIHYRVEPDGVSVGTNKVYAAIHQFGGYAGRGRKVKIPARPFMPMDKKGDIDAPTTQQIMKLIGDWSEEVGRL